MAVRAKFVCVFKQVRASGQPEVNAEEAVLTFTPVMGEFNADGANPVSENRMFGRWTPDARLE